MFVHLSIPTWPHPWSFIEKATCCTAARSRSIPSKRSWLQCFKIGVQRTGFTNVYRCLHYRLSMCLSIHFLFFLSFFLSFFVCFPSVWLSVYRSFCLPLCMSSGYLSVYPSVYLSTSSSCSISISISMSIYPRIRLSPYLSTYPSQQILSNIVQSHLIYVYLCGPILSNLESSLSRLPPCNLIYSFFS